MADPRKILFTCHPFGPHLYPHAPVIKAFEAQGHDVRLATPDKLAQTARHYGIQQVSAGQDWTADPAIRGGVARLLLEQGNDAYCEAAFAHLAEAARTMTPDVLDIAREWNPDLIVTDIAEFGGALAGRELDIPVITSDNGLARLVHDLYDPVMRPILNDICEELGLEPQPEGAPTSFGTVLTPAPKELLLPDLDIPGLVSFRHENPRSIGERLPDGVFESDRTKIVTMFGSTGSNVPEWAPIFEHSYRTAIEAMANGPYDVLMSVGRGNVAKYADLDGPEEELMGRAVPARGAPNIKVVPHTAALPLALERADVAMLHAGFGSLREALAGGTPALYMPNQTDQPSNARMLEANGLGLMLEPRTATAEDVAARLEELVARKDEFSANVGAFQDRMEELPSLEQLTDAVNRSLELGDLGFRGLKEPPADPGAAGDALDGPRPDGPITIIGPAGAAADPQAEAGPVAVVETGADAPGEGPGSAPGDEPGGDADAPGEPEATDAPTLLFPSSLSEDAEREALTTRITCGALPPAPAPADLDRLVEPGRSPVRGL